eukprot:CAMPEP_0119305492 /NCGR_PEP_ID=MMETSP1333-20130426/6486_1 /TAXON_ID=418940 /ORGANISM="Scyphosphaera apsteinii, Strain RCC1455" /LENGTH=37 /DNA_ID= /DNA_START= /DNA_END= /DNA_ORIENTATION=
MSLTAEELADLGPDHYSIERASMEADAPLQLAFLFHP